jgi:hypothetical protein
VSISPASMRPSSCSIVSIPVRVACMRAPPVRVDFDHYTTSR